MEIRVQVPREVRNEEERTLVDRGNCLLEEGKKEDRRSLEQEVESMVPSLPGNPGPSRTQTSLHLLPSEQSVFHVAPVKGTSCI